MNDYTYAAERARFLQDVQSHEMNFVIDGKTGQPVYYSDDAPHDILTAYILTMVQFNGYETTARYLGIRPSPEQVALSIAIQRDNELTDEEFIAAGGS